MKSSRGVLVEIVLFQIRSTKTWVEPFRAKIFAPKITATAPLVMVISVAKIEKIKIIFLTARVLASVVGLKGIFLLLVNTLADINKNTGNYPSKVMVHIFLSYPYSYIYLFP